MKHLYLNMVATRKQLAEYVNKTNISHNNLQAASAVVKILHSAHVKLNIPLMLHQSLTRVLKSKQQVFGQVGNILLSRDIMAS